jgi:hypothetical protein
MKPETKRFQRRYGAAADAIARLDIDQEIREEVAEAVTEAFRGDEDFYPDLFRLLASDPLVACPGRDGAPCPGGRSIRIPMHLASAPDGRSKAWRRRLPEVRCVSCGGPR